MRKSSAKRMINVAEDIIKEKELYIKEIEKVYGCCPSEDLERLISLAYGRIEEEKEFIKRVFAFAR